MGAMLLGVLIALTITTTNAAAGVTMNAAESVVSAKYLLKYCNLTDEQVQGSKTALLYGLCIGTIDGINSTLRVVEGRAGKECAAIPYGVTTGEIVKIVVRYGERHPDRTHFPLSLVALEALRDAWPCNNRARADQ